MYELPISITINDRDFNIRNKGDYRVIIDCFQALNDLELTKDERIYASLIIFYEDINDIDDLRLFGANVTEACDKMFLFFNCNQPPVDTDVNRYNLLDWDKDSALICSAVNTTAGKEIRSEQYIHWWTFMSYYSAVKDSCLNNVLGIRYKIAKGKKLEKYETQFRKDNPQYFNIDLRTVEQRENDALLKSIWNKGKEV